jgi:hypothetical protein
MTGVGNTHRTWVGFLEDRPSSVLADGWVVAIPLAFLTPFEPLDPDSERATFNSCPSIASTAGYFAPRRSQPFDSEIRERRFLDTSSDRERPSHNERGGCKGPSDALGYLRTEFDRLSFRPKSDGFTSPVLQGSPKEDFPTLPRSPPANDSSEITQSGREDLNLRHPAPKTAGGDHSQ